MSAWCLGWLLVLPWISPYTSGPTPNAWPWLISAYCAVLLWLLRRRLNVRIIATAWLLAAGISAAFALLQYFGLAHAFSPWVSQTSAGEAFGNLRQRNQFATLTSIGLLALLGLLSRQTAGQRVPWWATFFALLLALGNAASSSRTGLLQWGLILVMTAWWALSAPRGQRRLLMLALQAMLAYGLAVVALPWLLAAVTGLTSGGLFGRLVETPGCASRRVLWSNVLTLIAQKPWLGWGWRELDYAHFMTLYPGERFCEILDNAHNLPLHLAVELGVPAAVAICALASWIVWRLKPWRETDSVRQMAWGVLAVILLHSLLEYPLWYGPFQIAFGLCVLLLCATPASVRGNEEAPTSGLQEKSRRNEALVRYFNLLVATLSIALLLGASVSYYRVSQIYLPPAERSAAYRDDTLNKIRGTWLFSDQVRFAELSVTTLNPDNAVAMYDLAQQLLHYSPEPRVAEKLIESAVMLGRDEDAVLYLARFRAAYPEEHARWAREHANHGMPSSRQ
ncbi:MAG: polymerase [Polaromonas sp.]|nr:polymerase [Polaromonas sp.]